MTKQERLQAAWHHFESDGKRQPTSARQACEWAVRAGLLELPNIDPYDLLADDMAKALREEYRTDSQGRRYRVNHAVRVSRAGVQLTLWAGMANAPHSHMERAFAQRREQIVGDCVQLKTDVDVYNEMRAGGKVLAIQMVLDFREDVAEREELRSLTRKAA